MAEQHSEFMGSVVFALLVLLSVFTLPVYSQDCLAGDLGPVVDEEVDERCSGNFSGSVQIAAGLACYTGLTQGSLAEYSCNCLQYELEGSRTRVCQAGGTWNGSVPQCLPQCESIPDPQNGFNEFVGPVDCSADSPNVTATYSCGLNKDNRMIQFNTSTDGDCQWPDPPCRARITTLATTGIGFYGSVAGNIFVLALGLVLCYKQPHKILIPVVLVLSLILPPVGLFMTWWLVREQVPASMAADRHASFARKWWRAILVIVGSILWLICFVIWIALAAIFAPPHALPTQGDYRLLIAGFVFVSIAMIYWIVGLQLLCQLSHRRRCCATAAADKADASHCGSCKGGGKGPEDVPMSPATQDESGQDSLWKPSL